ncbi:MAG TPA: hypothetical protein VID28_23635 [Methylomirabilota bacterium]|jgi:plastocyanin
MPRRASLALLALAGLAACSTAAQGPSPTVRTVVIKHGLYMDPITLEVNPGEQVAWVNDAPGGQVQVQFRRTEGAPYALGFNPVAQFDKPGRFGYTATALSPGPSGGDRIVTRIEGTIVVKEPPPAPAPAPPPAAAAPAPPPARVERQPPPASVVAADLPPSRPDVVRVKAGREAATTYGYQPQQGVVLKIESIAATPAELRAGDNLLLQVQYTILAPPDQAQMSVREVWMISRNNLELTRLEKDAQVSAGTYAIQYRVALPPDTPEGAYTLSAQLEVIAAGKPTWDTRTARFVIRR